MPDRPPLRDYSRSRAVAIGTWDYTFLPALPAAANSLKRTVRLLTGPLCGWPKDKVSVLGNRRIPGNLPDRLITLFEDATDVALFYYVGHGQIDTDDQLCLCLGNSRTEANRRAATSLPFQAVRRALMESPATTKILILDCCFAGLANRPANTLAALADGVMDRTVGTGAYTMAASSAYTTAWYDSDPSVARPQTFFTKYFADLIETGIPGMPPGLQLHQVFSRVRDNLARDQRPVPDQRSVDAAREFVFAHNAAPPGTHTDPEVELQRLTRRLAEVEAREMTLQAEAAEHRQELERLQQQARNFEAMAGDEQQQLLDELRDAERKVGETTAAQAAIRAEHLDAAIAASSPQSTSVGTVADDNEPEHEIPAVTHGSEPVPIPADVADIDGPGPAPGGSGIRAEVANTATSTSANDPRPDPGDTGENIPIAARPEEPAVPANREADKPAQAMPTRRRKPLVALLVTFIVILVALSGAGLWQWHEKASQAQANYPGPGTGDVTVQVLPGFTAISLASRLVSLDVIKAPDPFIAVAKDRSGLTRLAPGYFSMHRHMNAALAYEMLLKPSSRIHFVAIREGLRLTQTLSALAAKSAIPASAFAKAAKNTSALGLPAYARGNLEGYLFPAAYPIQSDTSAVGMLRAMVTRFKQEAASINLPQEAKAAQLTGAQVVTVASLLQAQGGNPKYYGKMARVIYNQLDRHMKLELDSTVLYALHKTRLPLTATQVHVKSPYNTFLHDGLPPGPINSPGPAALEAALHPADGNWLYFVTVNPKTGLTKFTNSPTVFAQLEAKLGGGKIDLSCQVTDDSSFHPQFTVEAEVGSGASYVGTVTVSFYDYDPSHRFGPVLLSPDFTVTYSQPWITSQRVPSSDIGSAEPSGCTASA